VFCESNGSMVAKDKAVKRFLVRNIVESAAIRDLQESCVYDSYVLPKLYRKVGAATCPATCPATCCPSSFS
jgi:small subunit ribosomal protein S26e